MNGVDIDAVHRKARANADTAAAIQRELDKTELLAALDKLTPAEKDVLIYAGKGLNNDEIGKLVGTKATTVRGHLHEVFKKLDVSTRVEAAVIAAKVDWL